jgi:hypothetical protein
MESQQLEARLPYQLWVATPNRLNVTDERQKGILSSWFFKAQVVVANSLLWLFQTDCSICCCQVPPLFLLQHC